MLQDIEHHIYSYTYHSVSRFQPGIQNHYFKLRCQPCQNNCQRLCSEHVHITPACRVEEQCDGLGNRVLHGAYNFVHDSFEFQSVGTVLCTPYQIEDACPHPIYAFETPLTHASQEMRVFAQQCLGGAQQVPVLLKARMLMEAIHLRLSYTPGSTDERTSAEAVFLDRQGVCQDYAHLMIALCRSVGLKARYVNGLLVGEGATHAWVEVYDQGFWFGFDPTHNRCITFDYIKIAHGRDVNDCPSNRGRILYMLTQETSEVTSIVIKK